MFLLYVFLKDVLLSFDIILEFLKDLLFKCVCYDLSS